MGSSLTVLDYSEHTIAGTTVSFNCSQPREVLLGSNSTTCMDNGRWEPDPSQIMCKGIKIQERLFTLCHSIIIIVIVEAFFYYNNKKILECIMR